MAITLAYHTVFNILTSYMEPTGMVCLCVLAWGCTAEYSKFVLYVYVSCKCVYIISIDIYACLYNNVIYIHIYIYPLIFKN